jgi:tRNA threonylcarbamoyl adenosine modification protein YjeE
VAGGGAVPGADPPAGGIFDETALATWGEAFGRGLHRPAVVGLSGELGAGKTTLARAIAAGLGVRQPVTSPTFALVHRYDGAGCTVYHVDGYRLRRPGEAADLGFDEMAREGDAVVLVEWPERFGAELPPLTWHLRLSYVDDPARRRVEVG